MSILSAILPAKHRRTALLGFSGAGKTVIIAGISTHPTLGATARTHARVRTGFAGLVQRLVPDSWWPRTVEDKLFFERVMRGLKGSLWPPKTAWVMRHRFTITKRTRDQKHTLVDIPGEMLADFAIANMTFSEWSAGIYSALRDHRVPVGDEGRRYLELPPNAKEPERLAKYKRLLAERVANSDPRVTPSSFILSGVDFHKVMTEDLKDPTKPYLVRLSGCPGREFAPLDAGTRNESPNTAAFRTNYEAYRQLNLHDPFAGLSESYEEWSDRFVASLNNAEHALYTSGLAADSILDAYKTILAQRIATGNRWTPIASFVYPDVDLKRAMRTALSHQAYTEIDNRLTGIDTNSQFAPMDAEARRGDAELYATFERRYNSYKADFKVLLADRLSSCHHVVVLIDVAGMLEGPTAAAYLGTLDCTSQVIKQLSHSYKLILAATKVDRLHSEQRHLLQPLLNSFAHKALEAAQKQRSFFGIQVAAEFATADCPSGAAEYWVTGHRRLTNGGIMCMRCPGALPPSRIPGAWPDPANWIRHDFHDNWLPWPPGVAHPLVPSGSYLDELLRAIEMKS